MNEMRRLMEAVKPLFEDVVNLDDSKTFILTLEPTGWHDDNDEDGNGEVRLVSKNHKGWRGKYWNNISDDHSGDEPDTGADYDKSVTDLSKWKEENPKGPLHPMHPKSDQRSWEKQGATSNFFAQFASSIPAGSLFVVIDDWKNPARLKNSKFYNAGEPWPESIDDIEFEYGSEYPVLLKISGNKAVAETPDEGTISGTVTVNKNNQLEIVLPNWN